MKVQILIPVKDVAGTPSINLTDGATYVAVLQALFPDAVVKIIP